MEELGAIDREVDALEQVQAELARVASRDDERRRHDLVELRRQLAHHIAQVGKIAEPVLARRTDDATMLDYRSRFSRMRSAAAMHQANWPAVLLGEREDEYRASALTVREANQEFVAWMRELLAQLRR